jgi:hypothetical protein
VALGEKSRLTHKMPHLPSFYTRQTRHFIRPSGFSTEEATNKSASVYLSPACDKETYEYNGEDNSGSNSGHNHHN